MHETIDWKDPKKELPGGPFTVLVYGNFDSKSSNRSCTLGYYEEFGGEWYTTRGSTLKGKKRVLAWAMWPKGPLNDAT